MKIATIYIYDYIGSESVSANLIRQQVEQLESEGAELIEIHLNSRGGDVFEGITIYNFLKGKNVHVYVDGMAASIASVVAMAGKKIFMYSSSMMMIHNPWTFDMGDAEYMRKLGTMLDQIKKSIIEAYTERTGLSKQEVEDLMNLETWMTAAEAKKKGFATDVIKMKASAKNYVGVYAMLIDDDDEQNSKVKVMNKTILKFLGLPENATDAEVEAKLKEIKAELGLTDEAGIKEIMAKIAEFNADEPAPAPAAPAAAAASAAAPVVSEEVQEMLDERAENLVNNAIADFKINAADKDVYLAQAKADYKGTKKILDAKAKDSVKPGKVTTPSEPGTTVDPVKAAADFFKAEGRAPQAKAKQ